MIPSPFAPLAAAADHSEDLHVGGRLQEYG